MAKNLKFVNSLVKKSQLIHILKNKGIKRFNKKALKKLSCELENKAKDYAELLSRRLMLEGRKTLTEKDIVFDENKRLEEFEV